MVETRTRGAKKVLKIITLALIGLVLIFGLTIGGLCLSGYRVLWVQGDSAIQKISPFSLVLVKPCDVSELKGRISHKVKMGDFAVRFEGDSFVTHEVYRCELIPETGEWGFDTIQAGDSRVVQTDANKFNGGKLYTQKNLAGKVVARDEFIGKFMAWIQGYSNLDSYLDSSSSVQDKQMTIVFRVALMLTIVYGITKFAEWVAYKEDNLY